MSFILKSTDFGANWNFLNLTFPMQDVHFTDPKTGFISGTYRDLHYYGGFLMKTEDGGQSWELENNPGFVPARIYFLNDSLGYITDSWGWYVYATSDGGENWMPDEEMQILGRAAQIEAMKIIVVLPFLFNFFQRLMVIPF